MSIHCPKCGGPSRVIDRRQGRGPLAPARRRRVCIDCEHRYTTMEVSRLEYMELMKIKDRQDTLATVLSEIMD